MGINHSDGRTGRFPPVVPKTGMHSISNHSCTGIKRLVHKSIIFCPEIVTPEPVLKPPTIWQSNYSTFVKQQLKGLIFKEKHSRGDFQTSGTPNRISQPYYCKETFVQSVCVFGPLNAAGGFPAGRLPQPLCHHSEDVIRRMLRERRHAVMRSDLAMKGRWFGLVCV